MFQVIFKLCQGLCVNLLLQIRLTSGEFGSLRVGIRYAASTIRLLGKLQAHYKTCFAMTGLHQKNDAWHP